jgi:hypothetical protein
LLTLRGDPGTGARMHVMDLTQPLVGEDEIIVALDLTRRLTLIIYLNDRAEPALLASVQTPPLVFTVSKPCSDARLQEVLSRALASWSDGLPPSRHSRTSLIMINVDHLRP